MRICNDLKNYIIYIHLSLLSEALVISTQVPPDDRENDHKKSEAMSV